MGRYVEGDAQAFEALYAELSPRLFGYLLRLCRERHQAEDLVQVTFAKIHRARDSYFLGAPLLPWVLAIARRSFFDVKRRAKVRPEYLSNDGVMPEPPSEEATLNVDLADALDKALGRLPSSYSEAIQLTKITGLSLEEAAEVLGTSKTAVKLRVHRGYKLLRKDLERFGRELFPEGEIS
jgi:RNA polymerase sigma-70 factor (ECF subfamily)